jgi:hypothetical protein
MKRILLVCVIASILTACSKDKFKSQPQVEITSFGPSEVFYGQTITLKATVTDKEGDLQDSVYIVRKRFNGQNLLTVDTSIRYDLSTLGFPNKQTIEIQAQFSYGETTEGKIYQAAEDVDRNFSVGIIVIDRAGHRSDYVESKPIILRKS